MNKHKKYAGIALVAVAVLLAAGLAAGGGTSGADPGGIAEGDFQPDEVSLAIDKALGRESPATLQQAPADTLASRNSSGRDSSGGVAAAPAPASDAAGTAIKSGGGASSAPDALPLGSVDDRKIVQTATVRMQVKDVNGSFGEVGNIAAAAGGFVASSNFSYQGDQQIAAVTIRVPAGAYQDVLRQVRALGAKVDSEASNASDVTEEYSDLQARIRTLEATETQLLQLLGQAKNVSEVLQVQDRLNSVRTQIEQAKGRVALLDKLSDFATISVSLRPLAVPVKTDGGGVDLGAEISRAWDDSLEFLGGIAAGVLTVLVFSWWLIPLAVPAAIAWQRWSRSRPAATPAAYD